MAGLWDPFDGFDALLEAAGEGRPDAATNGAFGTQQEPETQEALPEEAPQQTEAQNGEGGGAPAGEVTPDADYLQVKPVFGNGSDQPASELWPLPGGGVGVYGGADGGRRRPSIVHNYI